MKPAAGVMIVMPVYRLEGLGGGIFLTQRVIETNPDEFVQFQFTRQVNRRLDQKEEDPLADILGTPRALAKTVGQCELVGGGRDLLAIECREGFLASLGSGNIASPTT